MTDKDVTNQVKQGPMDDEILCITKCVCGKQFALWDFVIRAGNDDPVECPECDRRLYFTMAVRVYEVQELPDALTPESTKGI